LRLARMLGGSDAHRLIAFEWLPGRTLLESPDAPLDRVGAALVALHAQRPDGLEVWTREAEVADLNAVAKEVAFICPWLAGGVENLAARLAERLAEAPPMRVSVHGDFSGNQVLVDGESVAIIDLDWAGYGDPADDLGNFLA